MHNIDFFLNMKKTIFILLVAATSSFVACKKEPKTDLNPPIYAIQNDSVDQLKINQIQVVGSHNSYRKRTDLDIFTMVTNLFSTGILGTGLDPGGWDYSHVPLPEQFGAFGMRAIELDIYEDAQGGRFAKRGGLLLVDNRDPVSGIAELDQPGYKIIHIPDFDYNTNYYSFVSALKAVKVWSEKNPNHIPIFIQIESKIDMVGDQVSFPFLLTSQPYTAASADAVDQEIKGVFGNDLDKVITPDDIRGSYNTLREAVLAGSWPTLGESRGKIMFVMEGAMVPLYKQGHPSLEGRAMFTFADPGDDEAAFVILNNPISDMTEIQQVVAQGFIVRTRCDSDTEEARTGDYSTMNAAFASGAQILSTDYYQADERYKTEAGWTDYHVAFPSGTTFRINPVTASDKVSLGFIGE